MTDTHQAATIGVRLSDRELAALDAWRRRQADRPEREEALRRLAAQVLRDEGGSETIALEELNASNDE